ncbi:hypothetical protein DPV78_010089 [Talaromyces pinophilus]|nr:hypothetical protein DPV78_010089 [Talaromyces pinophilus]
MLQPILTPKKMWPGGIPSTARIHQDGDISYDEMREPTKGWPQFVHEEWIPKTDLIEETKQRRAVVERWASSDQALQDARFIKFNTL